MSGAAEPAGFADGRTRVRVRYPETDRMNVAYHAQYLVWFEMGRTELMRELGCSYAALEDRDGLFFPVRQVGARYHESARYDDVLDVQTALTRVGGASVRFDYVVRRASDGRILASGHTEHAAVGRDGRPRRLPSTLRRTLAEGAAGA